MIGMDLYFGQIERGSGQVVDQIVLQPVACVEHFLVPAQQIASSAALAFVE